VYVEREPLNYSHVLIRLLQLRRCTRTSPHQYGAMPTSSYTGTQARISRHHTPAHACEQLQLVDSSFFLDLFWMLLFRLLAASIGVISLPPGNADKGRQRDLCSHMNRWSNPDPTLSDTSRVYWTDPFLRRHKSAQYVQRASANLYTLLFFKWVTCPSCTRSGYLVLSAYPWRVMLLLHCRVF